MVQLQFPKGVSWLCVSRLEIAHDDGSVLILGPGLPIHAGWNQSLIIFIEVKGILLRLYAQLFVPWNQIWYAIYAVYIRIPYTQYTVYVRQKKERNVRKSELPSASFTWDFWGPHRKYMKYTRLDIRSPLEQTTPLGTGGRLDG